MSQPDKTIESQPKQRKALEPPQFSLATLFWVIACLGVLFALMSAAGPIGGFALLLLVLAILAHVAGNKLGTRLRSFGNEKVVDLDDHRQKPRRTEDARLVAAPPSSLSHTANVTWTMLIFSAVGAVSLGVTGSALLIWLAWSELNLATTIVAVLSPTVLGGIIGFAVSSFTQTAGGAWREASFSYKQEKLRRIREMQEAATRRSS